MSSPRHTHSCDISVMTVTDRWVPSLSKYHLILMIRRSDSCLPFPRDCFMKKGRTAQSYGFSLIECMIAVTVLAVSLMGLAQLMGVSVYHSAFARSNTMAVSVAQQKLESLRLNYTKDLLAKVTTPGSGPSSDLTAGTHSPVSVTLAAPTESAMPTVTFNVCWFVTINGDSNTGHGNRSAPKRQSQAERDGQCDSPFCAIGPGKIMNKYKIKIRSAYGFSFLEMIVTTIVLALVSASIYTFMFQGQRSYQSQRAIIGVTQNARIALDQIMSVVRQAGNDPQEIGLTPVEILGTNHIRLNSDLTGSESGKGEPDGDTNDLYEQVVVRYDSANKTVQVDLADGNGERVLLDNVESGDFTITCLDIDGSATTSAVNIRGVRVEMMTRTSTPDLGMGQIQSVTLRSEAFLRSKGFSLF